MNVELGECDLCGTWGELDRGLCAVCIGLGYPPDTDVPAPEQTARSDDHQPGKPT